MTKSSGQWKRGDFVYLGGVRPEGVAKVTGKYQWITSQSYHLCAYELVRPHGAHIWEIPRVTDMAVYKEHERTKEYAQAKRDWDAMRKLTKK